MKDTATAAQTATEPTKGKEEVFSEIIVETEVRGTTGITVKKGFTGRWIIGDNDGGEMLDGKVFSVAVTARGGIVVVGYNREDETQLMVAYETFADLCNGNTLTPNGIPLSVPADLISLIAAEMDIDYVQRMDI